MLQLVEPVEPSTTAKKAVIGKARSALRRALNKIRWPVMAQNNSGIRWPCYTTIIWYPSVWKNYVSISIHLKTYTFTASRGNFSSQVFIYKYNFGYGNLKCSGHKPLNLSTGFHSPDLAVLTLFRCCLQHLSLAFARCASGFVDSLFEYIWMMYLNLFEYIWTHGKTSKDIKRHQKTSNLSLEGGATRSACATLMRTPSRWSSGNGLDRSFFVFISTVLLKNPSLEGGATRSACATLMRTPPSDGGGLDLKCAVGFVGSMVKQSYFPFVTFSVLPLCSEGFIERWQWMMRGAKGEISIPSH